MRELRTWTFPYADAIALVGNDDPIDVGDELGLRWRGELLPPELASPRSGRRVIVVAVRRIGDVARSVTVALFEDGSPAEP